MTGTPHSHAKTKRKTDLDQMAEDLANILVKSLEIIKNQGYFLIQTRKESSLSILSLMNRKNYPHGLKCIDCNKTIPNKHPILSIPTSSNIYEIHCLPCGRKHQSEVP